MFAGFAYAQGYFAGGRLLVIVVYADPYGSEIFMGAAFEPVMLEAETDPVYLYAAERDFVRAGD